MIIVEQVCRILVQFVRYIISKEQERTAKACHIYQTSEHMGAKKAVASV